jgi:hypothetical protein
LFYLIINNLIVMVKQKYMFKQIIKKLKCKDQVLTIKKCKDQVLTIKKCKYCNDYIETDTLCINCKKISNSLQQINITNSLKRHIKQPEKLHISNVLSPM